MVKKFECNTNEFVFHVLTKFKDMNIPIDVSESLKKYRKNRTFTRRNFTDEQKDFLVKHSTEYTIPELSELDIFKGVVKSSIRNKLDYMNLKYKRINTTTTKEIIAKKKLRALELLKKYGVNRTSALIATEFGSGLSKPVLTMIKKSII